VRTAGLAVLGNNSKKKNAIVIASGMPRNEIEDETSVAINPFGRNVYAGQPRTEFV